VIARVIELEANYGRLPVLLLKRLKLEFISPNHVSLGIISSLLFFRHWPFYLKRAITQPSIENL
jgi:hypothetical protein